MNVAPTRPTATRPKRALAAKVLLASVIIGCVLAAPILFYAANLGVPLPGFFGTEKVPVKEYVDAIRTGRDDHARGLFADPSIFVPPPAAHPFRNTREVAIESVAFSWGSDQPSYSCVIATAAGTETSFVLLRRGWRGWRIREIVESSTCPELPDE